MEDSILKKAALQVLCDHLGYEEGLTYFDLLKKKGCEENYSHSKSYRILKSLFGLGAVAKIKDDKDFSEYIPLPPTFLNQSSNSKKLVSYLENIYIKNYPDLFLNKYLELALKGTFERSLAFFLIDKFMKDSAIIVSGGTIDYEYYSKHLEPSKLSKVQYICREDYLQEKNSFSGILKEKSWKISNRRVIIIDESILIELVRLPNPNSLTSPESTKYIGYLVSNNLLVDTPQGKKNYISLIKNEIVQAFNLTV